MSPIRPRSVSPRTASGHELGQGGRAPRPRWSRVAGDHRSTFESNASTAVTASRSAPPSIVIRTRASSSSMTIASAAAPRSCGAGDRTSCAMRTVGGGASRPSLDDHHSRIPADQPRPALHPLGGLATRSPVSNALLPDLFLLRHGTRERRACASPRKDGVFKAVTDSCSSSIVTLAPSGLSAWKVVLSAVRVALRLTASALIGSPVAIR